MREACALLHCAASKLWIKHPSSSPSQFAPLAIFHQLRLQSLKINKKLQRGNERMCWYVKSFYFNAARTETGKLFTAI